MRINGALRVSHLVDTLYFSPSQKRQLLCAQSFHFKFLRRARAQFH